MSRRLKPPSPALVVALVSLFLTVGGGAALASGLISGKQIVDRSIAEKKLARSAVKALHGQVGPPGPRGPKGATGPQGPGAISFNLSNVPQSGSSDPTLVRTVDGVDVVYYCYTAVNPEVGVDLIAHTKGDVVFASGDKAHDGGQVTQVQESTPEIESFGNGTADLDVIAWAGGNGTLSRFDLGGYHGATGCNVWGVITPAVKS